MGLTSQTGLGSMDIPANGKILNVVLTSEGLGWFHTTRAMGEPGIWDKP